MARPTNNSRFALLPQSPPSTTASLPTSSSAVSFSVTTAVSSSITLSQEALTQAFAQALENSLPQILAALHGHSSPLKPSPAITSAPAGNLPVASQSPSSSIAGQTTGNILVPSFISTYCTLGNPSQPSSSFPGTPSWFGSRCATSASSSSSSLTSLASCLPSSASLAFSSTSSSDKVFVVGTGYSTIQEKTSD